MLVFECNFPPDFMMLSLLVDFVFGHCRLIVFFCFAGQLYNILYNLSMLLDVDYIYRFSAIRTSESTMIPFRLSRSVFSIC